MTVPDAPGAFLAGRVVVITRPRAQSERLAARLEARGARVLSCPTIRIAPPADAAPLTAALAALGEFGAIIFTSINAVEQAAAHGPPPAAWAQAAAAGLVVAAVGPGTAETLAARGLPVHCVPARHGGVHIVPALAAAGHRLAGARVLVPRGDRADDTLPEALRAAGADARCVIAYENRPVETLTAETVEALAADAVDAVAFTSGSTAAAFFAALPEGPAPEGRNRPVWVSIGPGATRAIRAHRRRAVFEAAHADLDGLVAALAAALAPGAGAE